MLVTGNSRLAWPFGSIRGVLSSGEVVNRPSDRVERRVSDGLFVMP